MSGVLAEYLAGYDRLYREEEREEPMKTIFVLLALFFGLGLLARQYNAWMRLLLIVLISGMLLFIYLA